ncbi:GDSL-type esterase/lipase family protein [Sphingomonas metalli]|nr:GDSL-type esterase/lipase family protein [Sphingomonas metalli]
MVAMLPIARRSLLTVAALCGIGAARRSAAAQSDADFANLARYADDNRRLIAAGHHGGIVFLGDSITEGWGALRPAVFGANRINRGISGQTSAQMLVRMMPDVVALRPQALHLMAGTNDVGAFGPDAPDRLAANLTAICQIAHANGIAVLLASVPPTDALPWQPGLETVGPIRRINRWIAAEAPRLAARMIDYTPVLATPAGAMRPGMAGDGVHPTADGFAAMETVLLPVLRELGL